MLQVTKSTEEFIYETKVTASVDVVTRSVRALLASAG
jgi:hypothetical protein